MTINSYLGHNNRMHKLIAAIGIASLSTTATAATLEEVVVTAQKRSESLQDVGAAVSTMSSDDLNRLNIKSGRDLFDRLPNISLQTNASESQAQVSMRGLSFSTFNLNAVQPVGLFQDEINLNSPQASGLFLFDLERIEVVRGPQNTLYGRNTTGGAVNFISKRPKIGSGTTGDIAVTYGRFNQLDFDAAVGFDLGDTAAARIAVNSRDRDGIFENKFTGDDDSEQDKKAIRAQLVWEPSSETEILFNYHWGQVDADSRRIKTIGLLDPNNIDASTVDFKNGLTGNCPLPGKGDLGSGCVSANWAGDQGYADTDDFDISADLASPIDKITDWGSFLHITHDFSSFTLTSITGYKENEFRFAHDDDGSPFTVYNFYQNADQEQISQELRFSSPEDQDTRWIAGLYYFKEDLDAEVIISLPQAKGGMGGGRSSQLIQSDTVYSGFSEFEWDINDKVTLIVGGRYSEEKKEGSGEVISTQTAGLSAVTDGSDGLRYQDLLNNGAEILFPKSDFSKTWRDWGAKFGLEYKMHDDTLIYTSASRGIKAGSFATGPAIITGGGLDNPVDPETVWAYEVGVKTDWLDRSLRTNLAVFYNDYQNQQLQTFVIIAGEQTGNLVNIDSSSTAGIELEVNWLPQAIEGLSVDVNMGWLTTEIKKDDTTGNDLEGNDLVNSPELTATVVIRKEWDVNWTESGIFSIQLDGNYTAEREFDIGNNPLLTADSYTIFNASASYQFGQEQQYTASLWGKNITDELYFQNMAEGVSGDIQAYINNPASYGVTLSASF